MSSKKRHHREKDGCEEEGAAEEGAAEGERVVRRCSQRLRTQALLAAMPGSCAELLDDVVGGALLPLDAIPLVLDAMRVPGIAHYAHKLFVKIAPSLHPSDLVRFCEDICNGCFVPTLNELDAITACCALQQLHALAHGTDRLQEILCRGVRTVMRQYLPYAEVQRLGCVFFQDHDAPNAEEDVFDALYEHWHTSLAVVNAAFGALEQMFKRKDISTECAHATLFNLVVDTDGLGYYSALSVVRHLVYDVDSANKLVETGVYHRAVEMLAVSTTDTEAYFATDAIFRIGFWRDDLHALVLSNLACVKKLTALIKRGTPVADRVLQWGNEGGGGGVSFALMALLPSSFAKKGGSCAEECSVCMQNLGCHELLRALPCMHVFHAECINTWLRQYVVCPNCKTDVAKELRRIEEEEEEEE